MYNQAAIPASVLTLPGTCNLNPYTSSLTGLTFGAETLLFGIEPIERVWRLTGLAAFTITINMSFKTSGWNKFWNQKTRLYESIYEYNGLEYKPYTPTNFSAFLF